MRAASELVPSSMELLAFASRQFAPKIVDLSVRFIRVLFYYSTLCASVAGGGSRPRNEAPLRPTTDAPVV